MINCIFCQIAKGKKPSLKVYEDEHFFAFLDHAPYAYGHVMLIPKKHYRWVWQIKEPGLNQAAGKICQAMMRAFPITTITYLSMGWMIDHAHLHLIPRKTGDRLISEETLSRTTFSPTEMTEAEKKITAEIKNGN